MSIYTAHIIANCLTAIFIFGSYLSVKYRDMRGVGGVLLVLLVLLCSSRDMPYFGAATSWLIPSTVAALLEVNMLTCWLVVGAYFAFWAGPATRKIGLISIVLASFVLFGLIAHERLMQPLAMKHF